MVHKGDVMERVVDLLRRVADAQGIALPSDTESLFDTGVLDSFGLLELLTAIEEKLKIKIPDEDLIPSNFETVAKIHAYISSRLEK